MLNYSNEVKPHYNVVITTPGNKMCSGYVKSLLNTISILNQRKITWIYQNESSSIVSNAREATISGSISLEINNSSPGKGTYSYDKIFMIDSDIVWSPDQFLELLNADVDFISGVYYEKTGTHAMVHVNPDGQGPMPREEVNRLQNTNELIEVYGVGLGFVCVKRGLFEELKRPWFKIGTMVYRVDDIDYDIPVGEDLYFCERVSQNNHKIYVNPKIVVGHVKENVVC
tara:strand:- start:328 stop:1011 length:684 start_codon:yes stop_codon:yes gene_type:complete